MKGIILAGGSGTPTNQLSIAPAAGMVFGYDSHMAYLRHGKQRLAVSLPKEPEPGTLNIGIPVFE